MLCEGIPVTPLAGLNIAVTRPRLQAEQLAQGIEQAGGKAIRFPLLEIEPLKDLQPLHAFIARLPEFELIIFISPNAVRYGMQAVQAAGVLPPGVLPPRLKVASVGQGSARALREFGVSSIIAPQNKFDSEALLMLPELQQVNGWRVAIFRGDAGRELLGDTLTVRGAHVEYVACYQRSRPQHDGSALLTQAPHALIVSSSEALAYLWDMLDAAGKTHVSALPLFVAHPRIAQAAQKMGFSQVVTTTAGDDGVLTGLIAWAKSRTRD